MTNLGEQARKKYMAEWRKKHPDRIKDYNRRYWERVAEKQNQEKGEDGNERNE